MKPNILFPVLIVAGLSISLLSGCYTQLAVYDDEPTAYSEDAYEQDAQEEVYDDYSVYPRSRFWLSYSYGYPDWYYYSSPYVYYPSYWDAWNHTVIYPYPWWYDWPPYGYAYNGWYWNRHHYYVYDSPYYSYRSGLTTTRNSGVRRSGTERRRDYDGLRGAGTNRSSVTSTAGRSASPTDGRAVAGRSAPTGRTPSIEFTRPRTSGSSSGRAVTTGRSSSSTRSSSGTRSSGVSSPSSRSGSRPAARPAQSSPGRQSVSQPSSPSRSSSSSGSSSSSSGSSRTTGRKR